MSLLRWMAGFVVALAIATFAVLNRESISVMWSPFHPPQDLPFYVAGLALMALGFLLGGLIVWMNSVAPLRSMRRKQRKKIKTLEKELGLAQSTNQHMNATSDFFPALPARKESNNT